MYLHFSRLVVSAIFPVLLSGAIAQTAPQDARLQQLLDKLNGASPALENCRVLASKRTVSHNSNHPVAAILGSGQLKAAQRSELSSFLKRLPPASIDYCNFVYCFSNETVYSESTTTNATGKTRSGKSLLSEGICFQLETNLENQKEGRALAPIGTVFGPTNIPSVVPHFLTGSALVEWISHSSQVALKGEEFVRDKLASVIEFRPPTAPHSRRYRLFLEAGPGLPVRLEGYLDSGDISSTLDLDFATNNGRVVCVKTTGKLFEKGEVFQEMVWEVAEIVSDPAPFIPSQEGFFPPGTYITDHRTHPAASYFAGNRIATEPELNRMSKDRRSVRAYNKAAGVRKAIPPKPAKGERVTLVRLGVLSAFAITALGAIFVAVRLRHRGSPLD